MLNIPYSIKSLLNTDSVNKNIRIHFPNGERSDISNNQIVQDSVEFTESLCSQNTLKFGLCESPIFECEVVGVGNIKGNTIEVYCEVYCDASVSGSVWQNDLQHYVYQIPYGTFVVDSCKRQADMIHRKIVAYSSITVQNIFSGNTSYIAKSTVIRMNTPNPEIAKNYVLYQNSAAYTYDLIMRLFSRLNAPVIEDYEETLITEDYSGGIETFNFVTTGQTVTLVVYYDSYEHHLTSNT